MEGAELGVPLGGDAGGVTHWRGSLTGGGVTHSKGSRHSFQGEESAGGSSHCSGGGAEGHLLPQIGMSLL